MLPAEVLLCGAASIENLNFSRKQDQKSSKPNVRHTRDETPGGV